MILLHFDGEKQREIQTNFQVKQSGSRQIRKKSIWGWLLGMSTNMAALLLKCVGAFLSLHSPFHLKEVDCRL